MGYIKKLNLFLGKTEKKRLLLLVLLSIFVSIVETIGVSAIMPFIDISINFDNIHSNPYYKTVYNFFNFKSGVDFAIFFGVVLMVFYFFRAAVNLFYTYALARFTQDTYAKLTKAMFSTYLSMPYSLYVNKNSSFLTKTMITETPLVALVVNSALIIISEIFVIIFLYALMLYANWKITIIFTILLILKMILLAKTVSKRMKRIGQSREEVQSKLYEILNRVFGNFKYIKFQDQKVLIDIKKGFFKTVENFSDVSTKYNFLDAFPRIFLETAGFSLLVFLLIALLFISQSNISYILPTLSLFALAMYRLLPSVNRVINGYNSIQYYYKSIDIVDSELMTEREDFQDLIVQFNNKIQINNVSFSYQDEKVVKNVSLEIGKGEKVAFVGESGSGKSTLLNLIVGIIQPTSGRVLIDDIMLDESNTQSWRSQIGYIPQQVYLFDGTVAENIYFGREEDTVLLHQVLRQANILDFLQKQQGENTLVGEGGVQLSGGQKQRIAIARALYGQPEILVLDEATSALDNYTEENIMHEIYQASQAKTLIIVAHRLSTIKGCDKIYKVEDGIVSI